MCIARDMLDPMSDVSALLYDKSLSASRRNPLHEHETILTIHISSNPCL
jgi:hypothetical protein